MPLMAHNYCPYELVFGRTNNLAKHFLTTYNKEPFYNIDDYAKESKFRLAYKSIAYKRARKMLDDHKISNKKNYDFFFARVPPPLKNRKYRNSSR